MTVLEVEDAASDVNGRAEPVGPLGLLRQSLLSV